MARKTVKVEAARIVTPEDIEKALQRIAMLEEEIRESEAAYNQDEQERRGVLTLELQPKRDEIEKFSHGLRLWGEGNREEFGKKKSLEFRHGVVGFRLGNPTVKPIKGVTLAAALALIKNSKFVERFVRTKEEINKEQVLADYGTDDLSEKELNGLGLTVEQSETFYVETKLAVEA